MVEGNGAVFVILVWLWAQTPSDLIKNNNNQKFITNTQLLVKHTTYLGGDL